MKHLKNKIQAFLKWLWLCIRRPTIIPKVISYHRNKVEIYEIISLTPGRMHAWVNSSVGRIKKQLKYVPKEAKIAWNQSVEKEINSIELPFVAPHVQ